MATSISTLSHLQPVVAHSRSQTRSPKIPILLHSVRSIVVLQLLTEHNIIFVGMFTAPGVGEWWDNNNGNNYRVSFKQLPPSSPSQNKSFTAPSTMKPPRHSQCFGRDRQSSLPPRSPWSFRTHQASLPLTPTSPTLRRPTPVNQSDKTYQPPRPDLKC